MTNKAPRTSDASPPRLRTLQDREGTTFVLEGRWTFHSLAPKTVHRPILRRLRRAPPESRWRLAVEDLDTAGACLLLAVWNTTIPERLEGPDEVRALLEQCRDAVRVTEPSVPEVSPLERLDRNALDLGRTFLSALEVLGGVALRAFGVLTGRRRPQLANLSREVTATGVRALFIVALVSLLIGVVVSYLVALEIRGYSATGILVFILGVAILRELGPVIAALLVAGRSGSAITAEIGVMRLRGELDALRAMGLDEGARLIDPKILALVLALPLLTLWSDFFALGGGLVTASWTLGIPFGHLLTLVQRVVPISNYWIGIGKGAVFGLVVGVVATTFGLRVEGDSETLGHRTMQSVVTAITMVIVVDAIAAVALRSVGIP
jgi:phospholipid/cholesterol/gamma-HCH transport system permease protein